MKKLIALCLFLVGCCEQPDPLVLRCDADTFELASEAAEQVSDIGVPTEVHLTQYTESPAPNCIHTGFVLTSEVWHADRCEDCWVIVVGSQATVDDVAQSILQVAK